MNERSKKSDGKVRFRQIEPQDHNATAFHFLISTRGWVSDDDELLADMIVSSIQQNLGFDLPAVICQLWFVSCDLWNAEMHELPRLRANSEEFENSHVEINLRSFDFSSDMALEAGADIDSVEDYTYEQ